MADNDRMVFRRASDQKWIDKRNGATRGFVHDTQGAAAASAKQHLLNSGGGDLSIKGRDGMIRSKDTIGRKDPLPPRDREH
jgi:hypothetical protein